MLSKFVLAFSLISISVSCANNSSVNNFNKYSNLSTAEDVIAGLGFAGENSLECAIGLGNGVINSLKDMIVFIPSLTQYAFFSVTNVTSSILNRNVTAIQSIYSQDAANRLAEIGLNDRMAREKFVNFTVNSHEIIKNLAKLAVTELTNKYSGFINLPSKDKSKMICGVIGAIPTYVVAQEIAIFGATKAVSSIGNYSGKYIRSAVDTSVYHFNRDQYASLKELAKNYSDRKHILPPVDVYKFKNTVNSYATIAETLYHVSQNDPIRYKSYTGICANAALALLNMLSSTSNGRPALFCAIKHFDDGIDGSININKLVQYLKDMKYSNSSKSIMYTKKAVLKSSESKSDLTNELNSLLKERQLAYVFSFMKETPNSGIASPHFTLAVKYNGVLYNIDNQIATNVERITPMADWINYVYAKRNLQGVYNAQSIKDAQTVFHIMALDAMYTF